MRYINLRFTYLLTYFNTPLTDKKVRKNLQLYRAE